MPSIVCGSRAYFDQHQTRLGISDLVRDIKADSSWFVQEKMNMDEFRWHEGYGAFSHSKSQVENVVNYILDQPSHHKTKTFREEY